jgi:hypothetical protein
MTGQPSRGRLFFVGAGSMYLESPFSALIRSNYTALQPFAWAKLEFQSKNGAIPNHPGLDRVIESLPFGPLLH